MKIALMLVLLLAVGQLCFAQAAKELSLPAGSCGKDAAVPPTAMWVADKGTAPGEDVAGPGVKVVEAAKPEYASRSFTFEAWLYWAKEAANKLKPEIIAENRSDTYPWQICFNDAGVLQLNWGKGTEPEKPYAYQLESQMLYDTIKPGQWYHLAVVFDAPEKAGAPTVTFFFTEQGAKKPFLTEMSQEGELPVGGQAAPAAFAIGRGVEWDPAGPMRIGSAAFYNSALPTPSVDSYRAPKAVPGEIIGKLPEGVSIDDEFEMSSLGVYGMNADGVILYSDAPRWMHNYWYAFRVRGAKGKTLTFQCVEPQAMGLSPWIAEDGVNAIRGPYGGKQWTKPKGFIHRGPQDPAGEERIISFSFQHTFASDDALVAGCPMITPTMYNAWLDQVAVKQFGAKIHVIGTTYDGNPIRVAEIGNADAPLVYFQCGQHSAVERFGYHLATEAFEQAAKDPELLKKTRWMILPVVNIDSYMVMPKTGDPNMNRVWQATGTHPTVSSIRKFLEKESVRTGAIAAFDCHAGTVQRGNTMAGGGSVNGLLEQYLEAAGFVPVTTGARPRPGPTPPAPADLTNWHPAPESGGFGGFGSALPGCRAGYTLELSTMVARNPDGAGPISPEIMRQDGVAFYKALKKLTDAPMPPPAAPTPGGPRGGRARPTTTPASSSN